MTASAPASIRFYETGCEELYNLADDLGEQHDLALVSDWASKRRELAGRLDAWLKAVSAQMPVPRWESTPRR